MLTAELIIKLAPQAREDYVAALVSGESIFEHYGINTPLRLAAFMATICHETGGLTIVRESFKYKSAKRIRAVWPSRPEAAAFVGQPVALANAVYGARMGNEENGTADDDGWRYRGGGLIQLTGRESYRAAGLAIGVNLESQPELIEDATVSLRAACWEFSQYVAYCDKGEAGFRGVCNGINRGKPLSKLDPVGWANRQVWYNRWLAALGVSGFVGGDTLNLGDQGALVTQLQQRLAALNYPIGRADGVFGSRTRSAVLTFQAENGLVTDGEVGPQTRALLNSQAAKPMPLGERATEGKPELLAAGSTVIATTDGQKTVAKLAGTVGTGLIAADQAGVLDPATELVKGLGQVKGLGTELSTILIWAGGHWYYMLPLLAYGLWWAANKIELRRIVEHQLGINLSK